MYKCIHQIKFLIMIKKKKQNQMNEFYILNKDLSSVRIIKIGNRMTGHWW